MTMKLYIPKENRASGAWMPEEDPEVGPWICESSFSNDPHSDYKDFLEVHPSELGTKMVFRVSTYCDGSITLHECAMLGVDKCKSVIARLQEFVDHRENSGYEKDS